ncbi:MAG: FG-GAP-like repeat-containing protein [Acidobacteria bacterium]|nr:FG-GAP-like repeat-containing protein [Acidobacteriota bacterium]
MIPDNCIRCARFVVSALYLIVLISLSAVSVFAQSATFARTDYPFLGNNHAVGDLNGDGNLDLAGAGENSAGVMLGNGDGTFRAKVLYPAGGPTQGLAAGDFNGDGRLDLIVTINDPQIGLSLLAGNGDGTFNAPANFPNTTRLDSPAVVAADLDNDGALDVVVAHSIGCFTAPCETGWTISLLFGNGDGTFQPSREVVVGTGMSEIAVGDFNRDGIKDLGIAGDRSQVYILLGIGNGTFIQQPTLTLTADTFGVDGTDIDVGDFNGDTVQDLVVAIALNGSRTAILIGNGDGTFRQPLIITEPNQRVPLYQSVADFNGDGRQDLAIGLGWGTQGLMEILNGNGDGTFRQPVLYLVPSPNSSISGGLLAAADFNKDGKPDIALQITGASPGLAVLRNTTGAAPAPLAFGSVTVTPSSVVGGATAQVSVTLAPGAIAPNGGLQFAVSSSNTSVVAVPSTVLMPAGSSSVQFTASTRSVTSTQSVNIRVSNNQLGSRTVALTVTPPPPAALTVSALTLTPSSLTGGSTAQGRVTLSATAQAATTVNLASSSASATVPASVVVPAGASSATFNINTTSVTATTSATVSATLGGVTRNAILTINPASQPPPSSTDTVTVTRAEYETAKQTLRVEATSTSSTATLQVFRTADGLLIGTLRNDGGGKYGGQFSFSVNPQNITVRSSLGGSATRSVVAR